jgi:hypothetical protein
MPNWRAATTAIRSACSCPSALSRFDQLREMAHGGLPDPHAGRGRRGEIQALKLSSDEARRSPASSSPATPRMR